MIQPTSLNAYREIAPSLGNRQREVLEFVRKRGSVSNLDISKGLELPINSITPRVKELREKGYLQKAFVTNGLNGRPVIYWKERTMITNFEPKEESQEEKPTTPGVEPSASKASDCPQPSVLFIYCECGKGVYGKLGIDNKSYVGKCRCGRQIIRKV